MSIANESSPGKSSSDDGPQNPYDSTGIDSTYLDTPDDDPAETDRFYTLFEIKQLFGPKRANEIYNLNRYSYGYDGKPRWRQDELLDQIGTLDWEKNRRNIP